LRVGSRQREREGREGRGGWEGYKRSPWLKRRGGEKSQGEGKGT